MNTAKLIDNVDYEDVSNLVKKTVFTNGGTIVADEVCNDISYETMEVYTSTTYEDFLKYYTKKAEDLCKKYGFKLEFRKEVKLNIGGRYYVFYISSSSSNPNWNGSNWTRIKKEF